MVGFFKKKLYFFNLTKQYTINLTCNCSVKRALDGFRAGVAGFTGSGERSRGQPISWQLRLFWVWSSSKWRSLYLLHRSPCDLYHDICSILTRIVLNLRSTETTAHENSSDKCQSHASFRSWAIGKRQYPKQAINQGNRWSITFIKPTRCLGRNNLVTIIKVQREETHTSFQAPDLDLHGNSA